jgi:hypothetical protein
MVLSFGVQRMQASTMQMVFWGLLGGHGPVAGNIFLIFTGPRSTGCSHHRRDLRGDGLYGYTTRRT